MSNAFTIRLPADLAQWLRDLAKRRGVSESQIMKENLEEAREADPDKSFVELAGIVAGPRDLSQQKGFGRSRKGDC